MSRRVVGQYFLPDGQYHPGGELRFRAIAPETGTGVLKGTIAKGKVDHRGNYDITLENGLYFATLIGVTGITERLGNMIVVDGDDITIEGLIALSGDAGLDLSQSLGLVATPITASSNYRGEWNGVDEFAPPEVVHREGFYYQAKVVSTGVEPQQSQGVSTVPEWRVVGVTPERAHEHSLDALQYAQEAQDERVLAEAAKTQAEGYATSAAASEASAQLHASAANDAVDDAELYRDQANDARVAAMAAADAAEVAETNATAAAAGVATNATQAQAARVGAENARATAVAAATSAEQAKIQAQTAQTQAQAIANAVAGAEADAQQHADDAEAAKNAAQTSATSAASHSANAGTSRLAAEAARDEAVTQRILAETARNDAQTAQAAADQSASEAAASEGVAISQASQANVARSAAEAARDDAQDSATLAATSESGALGYRNQAAASASTAQSAEAGAVAARDSTVAHRDAAEGYRDDAEASATAAAASEASVASDAAIASTAASNAADSETNAAASETNAASSEQKAELWAEEAPGVEVEPGKFSARHHAEAAIASSGSAETSQIAAAQSEANAAQSEANASASEAAADADRVAAQTARDKAERWADEAENVEVEAGKHSAKHHAIKAAASEASVNADSIAAQTARNEAESARDDAQLAQTAAESAEASAAGSATAAESAQTAAESARDDAQTAEAAASASATAASVSESNAAQSETDALAAQQKAEQWADNALNTPVEPGQFSAKHHATIASQHRTAAESARLGAETAEDGADLAQTAAELAQSQSESARDASQTAQAASEAARDDAQLAETVATTAETGAIAARNKAEQWADEDQGVEVEPGQFSAKSRALDAAASALSAAISESNASTSEINASASEVNAATSEANASNSATNAATSEANASASEINASSFELKAEQWAENPEDDEVEPGQFSALHHALKAAQSAADAATSAGVTQGRKIVWGSSDMEILSSSGDIRTRINSTVVQLVQEALITSYVDQLFTNNVTIQGDLDVQGELTSTTSSVITVDDAWVQLNSGNAAVDGGIQVELGTAEDARLFYDVSEASWYAGENAIYSRILLASDSLDADTLDGEGGAFYRNADNINAGTIADARLPSTISANTTGSAATLTTPRTIAIAGDATGSALFDGSGNVTLTVNVTDAESINGFDESDFEVAGAAASAIATHEAALDPHTQYFNQTRGDARYLHISAQAVDADRLDGQHGSFYRDASNLIAGTVPFARLSGSYNIDIAGNSATSTLAANATKLATPRSIAIGGDATGSANFDGSGGILITVNVTDAESLNGFDENDFEPIGSASAAVAAHIAAPDPHTQYFNQSRGDIRYLKIGDQAADSDLLDGQEGAFYRNASSLNAGTIADARLPATISSDITGNAQTASALATARTISLAGDLSGSASFDGSSNITITAAVANDSHTHDARYYTKAEADANFSALNVVTVAKSITPNTSWQNVTSGSIDLTSGTWAVEAAIASDPNGFFSNAKFSGVFAWFSGATDDNNSSEILLTRVGAEINQELFLRVKMNPAAGTGTASLEVSFDAAGASACDVDFKFAKLI